MPRVRRWSLLCLLATGVVAGCTSKATPKSTEPTRTSSATESTHPARSPSSSAGVHWLTMTAAGGSAWLLGTRECGSRTCSVVLRSNDGGTSWAVDAIFGPGSAALDRLVFANSDDGYAYGEAGAGVYWTRDGGRVWERVLSAGLVEGQLVVSDGRAYVVLDRCRDDRCVHQLATSTVTTDRWVTRTLPVPETLAENAAVATFGSTVWLVMTSQGFGRAYLFVSTNFGRTFVSLRSGGMAGIACLPTATSGSTMWAICASIHSTSTFRSTDAGRLFVDCPRAFDFWPGSSLFPVSDAVAAELYTVPAGSNSLNAVLLVTRNGGRTWRNLFAHGNVLGIGLATRSDWLVLDVVPSRSRPYELWRTQTAGSSWKRFPIPSS